MNELQEYIDYIRALIQETYWEKVKELHRKKKLLECTDSLLCQLDELTIMEMVLDHPEKLDYLYLRELMARIEDMGCYAYSKLYFPYIVMPTISNPFPRDDDQVQEPVTFTKVHNELEGLQGGSHVLNEFYHLIKAAYDWVMANYDPYKPVGVTLSISNNVNYHKRGTSFIPNLVGMIIPQKDTVTGWNLYRGATLIASATGLSATGTAAIAVPFTDTAIIDTTVYRLEAIRVNANGVSATAEARFIYPIFYGMFNGTKEQFNALSTADKVQVVKNLSQKLESKGIVRDLSFVGTNKTVIFGYDSTYGAIWKIENPSLIDESPAFLISPSPYTLAMNLSDTATIGDRNFTVLVKANPNYFDTPFEYDLIWK